MKPQAWKALSESLSSTVVPSGRVISPFCWYQGSSIERTIPTDARTASLCSGKSSRQPPSQRDAVPLTP